MTTVDTFLTLKAHTTFKPDEALVLTRYISYGKDPEPVHVEKVDVDWAFNQEARTWEVSWVTMHYRRVKRDGALYANLQTDSLGSKRGLELFPEAMRDCARSLPTLTIGAPS